MPLTNAYTITYRNMDADHRIQVDGWAMWCGIDLTGIEDMPFHFFCTGVMAGLWVQEGATEETPQDRLMRAIFTGDHAYKWE